MMLVAYKVFHTPFQLNKIKWYIFIVTEAVSELNAGVAQARTRVASVDHDAGPRQKDSAPVGSRRLCSQFVAIPSELGESDRRQMPRVTAWKQRVKLGKVLDDFV